MKARLILITILFFVALHISSCFLKPKKHFNDKRGVYKDKGMTKGQLVYLEERKQRLHPKKYHRKSVKQQKHEDRKERKEALSKNNITTPIDTSIHPAAQPLPTIQQSTPDTTQYTAPKTDVAPATPNIGPDISVPADQSLQPAPAAKKEKKKHKKTKQKDTQQQ